ncbi:MAG: hypothetical protein GX146_00580 [Myxococcales bacterium]|jgi:hypothetical protein|nr:hypothetical protein [Myxococcales bacterium]
MPFRTLGIALISLLLLSPLACKRTSDPAAATSKPAPSPALPAQEEGFNPDAATFEGPGKMLLPRIGKWALTADLRYFDADNLYDLINGGAEVFVAYGFTRIATADYRMPGDPRTVTAEVYHMGSPLGAFGRLSRYLENMADPSGAGDRLPEALRPFGIMGDGDLLVWKDAYLVHLTLLDEAADATPESIAEAGDALLPPMAETILNRIPGEAALPAAVQQLPQDHMLGRSAVWHPQHINDIKALRDGFTARYQGEDEHTWQLFVTSEAPDEAAARAMASALSASDMTEHDILAIAAKGTRVLGVLKDQDPAPPKSLVQAQLKALSAAF